MDRNDELLQVGQQLHVALLAEGVDRNVLPEDAVTVPLPVALLAEGVDRNSSPWTPWEKIVVALLAEGVDRNW